MQREARLERILTLVDERSFRTQAELVDALCTEGISVTQSSVSRDIRDLGLDKEDGVYVVPTPEDLGESSETSIWSFVTGSRPAGPHLLVVRCEPAMAQPVARAIDAADFEGVVGTVAGDDTVFVALDGPDASRQLQRTLDQEPG
jgi:transcriptional regulator of arginine metabolism